MAEQTDDLRQEIENNLAILREGLGVHRGAGLELDPPRTDSRFKVKLDHALGSSKHDTSTDDPRVLREEHLRRAAGRLQALLKQHNPAGYKEVDWDNLLRGVLDRSNEYTWHTRRKMHHAPGTPAPELDTEGRNPPGHFPTRSDWIGARENRSPEALAEEEYKTPGAVQRGYDTNYDKPQWAELDHALRPLLMRADVSKPPRNEEEAKAHRESAAKKALEK